MPLNLTNLAVPPHTHPVKDKANSLLIFTQRRCNLLFLRASVSRLKYLKAKLFLASSTSAAGSCSPNATFEIGAIASETVLPTSYCSAFPTSSGPAAEGACATHFPSLAAIWTAAEGTGRSLSCPFSCAGFATWAPGVSRSGPGRAAPDCSVRAPWNRRRALLPVGVMVGGSDRHSPGLREPRWCWPGWDWCGGRR